MSSSLPPFPSVRRVVTGHTPEGKAVFLEDQPALSRPFGPHPGSALRIDLYRTDEFPNTNAINYVDLTSDEVLSENGNTFRVVDYPPHSASPFHRTVTLDYGIVAKGSIVCQLDDDKRTTLNEGDVIIQRGNIHGWINDTDEWARAYFVMLASKPVEIDGKVLGTEFREPLATKRETNA